MLDYNKTERSLNIFSCYHRWSSVNPDVQLESYRWLEWWFFGSLKHLSDDPLRLMQVWLCTINNRIRSWKGRKLNQLSHNIKFHYPCLWESWFASCRCYPPFYFLSKSSLFFYESRLLTDQCMIEEIFKTHRLTHNFRVDEVNNLDQ